MAKISRKEFLGQLGIGAAFALTATCLHSCTSDVAAEPAEVDFEIDLSDSEFENLAINGGYTIFDGVVIARSLTGDLIAASVTCSHQNLNEITYADGEWFCTAHGARFDEAGIGLNANGSNGLVIFNTELNGNTLRIFSV